ncbi:MAG TPA: tetratricopeptide repeat protein [Pyrinomonadaceae bacterium]|jgi:tetratricopeptide (TPR) repeat protein
MKYFSRVAAAALLVLTCAFAVSAQVQQVRGKVTIKQADGTEVPVPNATIDFFRVDVSGKFETKTNKKGEYVHAGLPFTGRYTVGVSAPGAAPTFVTNIRFANRPDNNDFVLVPGDGRRLTLDEIKTADAANAARGGAGAAAGGGGAPPQPSAEDKKAAAEMAKKIAELEASNKKIEEGNVVVKRTFEAGNEAYRAKNYDQAIALFNEGLAARPDEAGLLISKSFALTGRGVARYNESIQNKNDASREAAYKDWREAAEMAEKAVQLTKSATAGIDAAAQNNLTQNRLAALSARAESMKFVGSKVDKAQADAAFAAYQEYIAAEADEAKKSKARFDAANVFFDAGVYDRAAAEFQKVVAVDASNADAYFKLGASLLNTGDKGKYQEASNYLAKFAEIAPDTNPLKADARSLLQFLKENENIKPMKIETPGRSGRRRG